jgi:hypothetical protein
MHGGNGISGELGTIRHVINLAAKVYADIKKWINFSHRIGWRVGAQYKANINDMLAFFLVFYMSLLYKVSIIWCHYTREQSQISR